MKKLPILFLLIVSLFLGCDNKNPIYKQLELVDSLAYKDNCDSAMKILKQIDVGDIEDDKTMAYYNMLQTYTQSRLSIPSNSVARINASIEFYERTNDEKNLSRAIYCKGLVLADMGDNVNAMKCFKKVESIAEKNKYSETLNLIYIVLASMNNSAGNNITGLSYAKKALILSKNIDDIEFFALSLNTMSKAFYDMNMKDSVLFYVKKIIPYLNDLDTESQGMLLVNIGLAYSDMEELDSSDVFLQKSLSVMPTGNAYWGLANNLFKRKKYDEAWRLWRKALETSSNDTELKMDILEWMAKFKKEHGDYEEASRLDDWVTLLRDTLKKEQRAEEMMQVQQEMENEKAERRVKEMQLTIVAISVVALILVVLALYYVRRTRKARGEIAENRMLIERYSAELESARHSIKTDERRIRQLEGKIETLRDKQGEIIGQGKRLYEAITTDGGTMSTWSKGDMEATIEYLRTISPEVVSEVEAEGKRLTPYKTLFLLLPRLGHDEASIMRMMGMTAGAYRTMKCRLRKDDVSR